MSLERHDDPDLEVEVEVVQRRFTVVTALPLKRPARDRLAELLDARVVDIKDPVDRVDLVLTPACSPQLIGALQRKYEGARVVVVELDDWEYGIESRGGVKRILRSGAAAYVLADSLEELARKITPAHEPPTEAEAEQHDAMAARALPATSTVDELIAAFLRESVEYSVRVHADDDRS